MGTHMMVWATLNYWTQLPRSRDLLTEIIAPYNIPLTNWFKSIQSIEITKEDYIVAEFLKNWGLDLELFAGDQIHRNEASYRPTKIDVSQCFDLAKSIKFLYTFWSVFEPDSNQSFKLLDRHLLKMTLMDIFKRSISESPQQRMIGTLSDQRDKVEQIVNYFDDLKALKSIIINFLCDEEVNRSSIFFEAFNRSRDTPNFNIPVMSRAALLLRIATGSCAKLIRDTNFTQDDLEFWWNPIGIERGLWEPKNKPTNLTELWADIDYAIEQSKELEISGLNNQCSLANIRGSHSDILSKLGECERIALWGLVNN
jgi:hypothetical protein